MRLSGIEWGNWKKERTKALQRARYRCEVIGCGVTGAKILTVHHILPRVEGGGNYAENLIALCGYHHDQAEILQISQRNLIRNMVEPICPPTPSSPSKAQIIKQLTASDREVIRRFEPEINKPVGQRWWDKKQREEQEEKPSPPRREGKILRRLRRRLLALDRTHKHGSWQDINKLCGHKKGGAWIWRIAHGTLDIDEDQARQILDMLPPPLWTNKDELDALVLKSLQNQRDLLRIHLDPLFVPIRGSLLAWLHETNPRTIRNSINRLRKAGHKINGSMSRPKGYRLDGGDNEKPTAPPVGD